MTSSGRPRAGIIIPARYASSRYPGKPLAMIRGARGDARSLIERTWQAARSVPDISDIWIATDDARIADAATAFDAKVVMTSSECRNGTERCADAISALADPPEIIINLQGDALLTPPEIVTALVDHMRSNPDAGIATPALQCSPTLYRHLVEDQTAGRVGGTTVVFAADGRALYFSKRVIPHLPPNHPLDRPPPVYLHMGVYAYRPQALARYVAAPTSMLEELEGLEQLRFLDIGEPLAMVVCPVPGWDMIELNNPSDLDPIETILKTRGIE